VAYFIAKTIDGETQMPDGRSSKRFEAGDMRQLGPELPRVYVISDVRLYREGLTAALQGQLDVIGAGGSGDSLDHIAGLRPDIVLLDFAARDSLALPGRAQQVLPGLLVVAFAVAELEKEVLACAEAGIAGYVMKNGSTEDLVSAVFRALKGELVCSPRIAALLFNRMAGLSNGGPTQSADAPLTRREREIAALIVRSLQNKEIARQLRLGPTTVKNHVHNILQKLNVHRRVDVARLQIDRNRWRVEGAAQHH
jgi:two-component system nitrate/nitrite response regulator NarL